MDGFIDSHPSAPSCFSRSLAGFLGNVKEPLEATHTRSKNVETALLSPGEPGDPGLPYAEDFRAKGRRCECLLLRPKPEE